MKGRKCLGLTYKPQSGHYLCNQVGNWPAKTNQPKKHRRMFEPATLSVLLKRKKRGKDKKAPAVKPQLSVGDRHIPVHRLFHRPISADELVRIAKRDYGRMSGGLVYRH